MPFRATGREGKGSEAKGSETFENRKRTTGAEFVRVDSDSNAAARCHYTFRRHASLECP